SRFIGGWTLRKFFLLIVSYIFYAAWNPPFVMLLWFSTLADWILAQKISQASCARRRKLYLFLSISVSLALLGYFKYGGFILDNFLRLMHYWGIPYQPMALDIVLPVG